MEEFQTKTFWEEAQSKLSEIKEGWKNYSFPNEQIEKEAKYKAEVCSQCPHSVLGVCTKCGCPLAAKTRSPQSVCPENKWVTPEIFGFDRTGDKFYQNTKGVILLKENNRVDIKKFVGDGYESEYVFRGKVFNNVQLQTILELTEVK